MKANLCFTKIILPVFLFIGTLSYAQPHMGGPHPGGRGEKMRENKEDIEAMKIAFITKKLSLTPEEAKDFWPVYDQYSEKLHELRKKRRQDMKAARDGFDEMSDKEVEAAVDNEIVFRQKELDVQKEYHSKFKTLLPVKKVAKLYSAEDQFKRVLLDKLKDKEKN